MEIKELYKKFLKAKGVDPKLRNLVAGKKIDVSKKGLWDKKKKQVIVPSNRITMKGPNGEQDFFKRPVVATGLQSGRQVMMQPGGEYYFPNDKAVHEVRMEEGGIIQPFLKMQEGGSIQTDITTPIRQKASATQDAFNAMLAQYETNKATPETDASSPEDMGFQLGGDVPVVIDSLFSNFAKGLGKKYAQMGMNNVGIPEDETPIRPSDLPSLPQDAGKFNQLLYNKADSRQKRLQAEFDVKEAADKEIRYVNNPKYADLLTAEFYGPEKTYDDLNEEESAKINHILTNRRTNLKNINLVSADLTKKGIKAGYDPNLHTMYVPQIPTDRGVHSHEFSHVGDQAAFEEGVNPGVGTYFTEQINTGMYPKESPEFLNQPSSLKLNQTIGGNREEDFNEADYLQDPSEVKARLRALRDSSIQQGYKLLEPGYDIKKYNKGFNKEEKKQYDQLKSSGLSDDKINELMYLFAKNNTPQSVMAQKGAFIPYQSPRPFLRTSPAGLAGYSDNTRVVTPESNLTDADRERITQIELAKRRGTISQGKKETAYEKAKRKSSFVEQEKERTGSASPISYVIDAVNPANVAFSAVDLVGNTGSAIKNTAKGNFSEAGNDLLQAGVNALGVLPAASQLKNIAKPLSKLARISPSQYKSIPTINNFSKFDELTPQSMDDIYQRVVNNPGYSDDVQEAIDYWQEYKHASPALDKSFTLELGEDLPLTRRLKTPLTFDESGYVINSGKPTAFSAGLGNDVLGQHRVHLMAPKGTKVSPISRAASSTTMQGEREVLFPTTSKFKKLHSRVNPQTGLEDYIIGLEMKKGGVVQMQNGASVLLNKPTAESQPNKEAMTAMMKSKIAYGDAFRNPTAMRMTNRDPRSYTFSSEDEMNGGELAGSRGNIYAGSYGDMVVPGIQDVNGKLKYVAEPFSGENVKRTMQQSMRFDNPEDAQYFGENYKEVAPMMSSWNKKKNGGIASESVTCSNCGHSWKISEGGLNTLSCHKCGGNAKMQMGGMSIPGVNGSVVANTNAPSLYKKYKKK